MHKKVFLEQIKAIRKIDNILFIGKENGYFDGSYNIYKASSKNEINDIRFSSSQIMAFFQSKNVKLDIIYLNENLMDLECILDYILKENGLLIFDNCDVPQYFKENLDLIYNSDLFFVYQRKHLNKDYLIPQDIEKRVLYTAKNKKKNKEEYVVGVGILTYNHEKYIEDCLNGVFKQSGNFKMKVIIVDDHSSDRTVEIIRNILSRKKTTPNIEISLIENEENKGVIFGLKTILKSFRDTDYFSFCEGDDFWISDTRLEKFIKYMQTNKYVSVAFNSMYILEDETNRISKNRLHEVLNKEFYLTQDLIYNCYFIGNLGCAFYDSFYLKYFDEEVYNLPFYDFFINTYYSTFGLIGYLDEYLSVYRVHKGSMWSALKLSKQKEMLIGFINQYNKYFNYIYDYEYCHFIESLICDKNYRLRHKKNLIIIDNIFPSRLSPFSYEEISSYLRNISDSYALGTYLSTIALSTESLREGQIKFKNENQDIADRLGYFSNELALKLDTKMMYFIFKSTTKYYLELLKKKKCSFIFELYPGGGFLFDNPECDKDLKEIMSLKGFRKVVVTQKPVMDYLLRKKICKKNQIELIFGVVMESKNKNKSYSKTKFYKNGKDTLDIVFMAHRYNEIGKDKGYDLFIETAKALSKKYKDIRFHVVGNYDENVIDVEEIKNKIKFYGAMDKNEFDRFYSDKDIIISPNRPNVLAPGAFDGFPTASCTEAGMREVVMVCSDEFGMAKGYYENKKNVVIIKNDVNDIVEKIVWLHKNPEKIKEIAKNTRDKIIDLYSFEKQMKPRIDLIRKELKIKEGKYEK